MKNPFKNLFKNPFKRKAPEEDLQKEDTGSISEADSSEEALPKTKEELRAEKEQARKEKAKADKEQKQKAKKQKAKKAGEGAGKKAKEPKPKLTREEKQRLKNDKAIEKARRKIEKTRSKVSRRAEKIRKRAAKKSEKLQLKKELRTEKRQASKDQKAERKKFRKELRDEIKAAKKDLPRSKAPFVIVPLAVILLLVSATFFLSDRNIGPFGALNLPQPLAFVKSIKLPEAPGFIKSIKLPSFKVPSLPIIGKGSTRASDKAVESMFAALKALDFKAASAFIDTSAVSVPSSYLNFVDAEKVMNATFGRLEYEMVSSDAVDDTEHEAVVKVTAVNIKPLMAEYTSKSLGLAFSNAMSQTPMSESDLNTKIDELFQETAANPDLATITNEITVKVVNTGGKWKVIPDEDLINALFGGALTAKGDFFSPDPPAPQPSPESQQTGSSGQH